jgi:cobalamin-dependent methionine synthase I
MLVIGKRINASRKTILQAIQERNVQFIQEEAKNQVEAGAQMLDVNAGVRIQQEVEDMEWLVKTVQEKVDVPLCIDSPNPKAIESGLKHHKGKALVNSIKLQKERIDNILPLIKKFDCMVAGLTMGETGMPETAQERFEICRDMIERVKKEGIPVEYIHIDPLVQPISTDIKNCLITLETIRMIKNAFPVKFVMGLSNISFGLPNRRLINRTFLAMGMAVGLDGALVDPTDKEMMATLRASEALLGQDEYCLNYLTAFREGKLQ